MSLKDKLKNVKVGKKSKEPLWKGPQDKGDQGGITFSMLNRFLTCRERFRLRVIEGLSPNEQFNHRIEYGQMWHVCEEALAKGNTLLGISLPGESWQRDLTIYCKELCKKYPLSQEQIDHWYNVCKMQFPLYVEHWSKHYDVENRTPLMEESVFHHAYTLPSGRVVYLRGKVDSVDTVGGKSIWLQENKTKGDIEEMELTRQLSMDLQSMMYLLVLDLGLCPTCRGDWSQEKAKILDESPDKCPNCAGKIMEAYDKSWKVPKGYPVTPVCGVRYNVVRRPLSGGKGSIVRHKATKNQAEETKEHFYNRLAEYIKAEPGHFFMRWNVEVSEQDITRFRQRVLDPILEQLCDWYEWVSVAHRCEHSPFEELDPSSQGKHRPNSIHWQHPFGCTNSIDEYGHSDLDEYMNSGSEVGLTRGKPLFTELT